MKKEIEVHFAAEQLLEDLRLQEHHGQLTDFLCGLAEVMDDNFTGRQSAAVEIAEGLSEDACRFLAEVICHHHHRNSNLIDKK